MVGNDRTCCRLCRLGVVQADWCRADEVPENHVGVDVICRRFVELRVDLIAIVVCCCSVPRQCPRTSLGSDSPWMSTAE